MKQYTQKQLDSMKDLALEQGFNGTGNKHKFIRESNTASRIEMLVLDPETIWLDVYERSEDLSISTSADSTDHAEGMKEIRAALKAETGE
jgi:hypothetical protein